MISGGLEHPWTRYSQGDVRMDAGVLKIDSHFCQQGFHVFGLPPQGLCEDAHGDAVGDFKQILHFHGPEYLLALALRPRARRYWKPGLGDVDEAGFLE